MSSHELLERAARLYKQGDLNGALSLYQDALSEQPDNADILHAIAVINAQLGELDKALEFIQQALALDLKNEMIFNSKGNILARMRRYADAAESYHVAIKINPSYAIAYGGLGKCLYQQQKLATAKQSLQKALKLQPSYVEAKYNLALVTIAEQEISTAIQLLTEVIAARSDFVAAIGQLGECYLELGQYDNALKFLDQRAELEPDHCDANHSLAQALALTGDYEAAIQYYEKVLMLDSKHSEANQNLANALVKMGDSAKALSYYFHQVEIDPTVESYYNIGVILMEQERGKDAVQYFEQALASDSSFVPTYLNLGAIMLKQQRYREAIDYYKQALVLEPDNKELQYIIDALSSDKTPERAPDAYLQSLFDQYAQYYDQHLTQCLDYHVPQQLLAMVESSINPSEKSLKIIDLGCGTGLVANVLKPYAKMLIGVDISQKMVEMARQKNLYDHLIQADIETALTDLKHADLIIAADVFSYIGDLTSVISKCHKSLRPGGYLLFSIEKTHTEPFILQQNMRYAHTKEHVRSVAKFLDFEMADCENVVLRTQQKKPVEGCLYLLKNPVLN